MYIGVMKNEAVGKWTLTQTIVLARVCVDMVVDGPWAADLGRRPKMKEVRRPEGCVWCYKGTEEDLAKARKYAESEGYMVFTYPSAWTGDEAFERAKADVMTAKKVSA